MGERVLARIVPILRDGISSDSAATRQGVCLGLKEVLDNMGRHQLQVGEVWGGGRGAAVLGTAVSYP